jgi:hydroxypyruvate isomerase
MGWSLRYTSHLGYFPPELRPQFLNTVGTADVTAHVDYAAEVGMSGVLYPWAIERPAFEVSVVKRALDATGLLCSCIVCIPQRLLMSNIWTNRTLSSRRQLAVEVARSGKVAVALGSAVLAVLVPRDESKDDRVQRDDLADNLREMATVAGDLGLTIAIEPMILLPGMLLRSMTEGLDVVRKVSCSNVGLIYDTAHVSMTDGDLMGPLVECFDHIALIQIADAPGRIEPGAGNLDIVGAMAEAVRRGYSGLVDLEHLWVSPTLEGEAAGLTRIRQFDTQLRHAMTPGPANSPLA